MKKEKGDLGMKSLTKNNQSLKVISQMVTRAFGELKIQQIEELKEGYFNVAYFITLSNGDEVILKIAPPKDASIMTYEKNIMFSEVESMKLVSENTKVPVPEILYYDNSHTLCDSDYFFMSKLPGQSFQVTMDTLKEEDTKKIQYNIGKYNAQINQIIGEKFGYYGLIESQGDDWYSVYLSMIKHVIHDGKTRNIHMGVESDIILELLERDKEIFKEVTKPRLVHWDLWAGNVFVENGRITGLIDFERCLWGDELMEVGFRTYGYNEDFFQGYGIKELTENQKIRAKWYDIYLFMINTLECEYRQYEDKGLYHWAVNMLQESIQELSVR